MPVNLQSSICYGILLKKHSFPNNKFKKEKTECIKNEIMHWML